MSSVERKTIVALLVSAVMSGCAGQGNGLDANGNPATAGSGGLEPLTADFQSIQDHVFTPICTACHIGANAPEGLRLDADHSYSMLVGMSSREEGDLLRVKPQDPDNSYLIRKLEGSSGIVGNQMPLGGAPLDPATIAVIRQWISAGASRGDPTTNVEAAAKAARHFAVNFTYPADQSISSEPVSQLVVEFNDDIDSNLIDTTTVSIARIDVPDRAIPVAISTAIPAGNSAAILIQPDVPLESGTYRVSLQGTLANMGAQALGSEYSFTFTVDVLR